MVSLACYAPIVVSWDSRRRRRGVSEFGEAASEPRFLFFHDEYHLFSRAGAELRVGVLPPSLSGGVVA